MKKYIVTVPDNQRAVFDEIVRENRFEVYEVADDSRQETNFGSAGHIDPNDEIPWVDARKLIDRDAT